MVGPFTYLDLALIAVSFISGLLAMYRGFARELLSIVSWISITLDRTGEPMAEVIRNCGPNRSAS